MAGARVQGSGFRVQGPGEREAGLRFGLKRWLEV